MLFKNRNSFDDEDDDKKVEFDFRKYLKYIIIAVALIIIFAIVIAIFKALKNDNPEIGGVTTYSLTLNGSKDIVIYQGDKFIEPGYTATDNYGNNLQSEVIITGNLNTDLVGKYRVNYILHDVIEVRNVSVTERPDGATEIHLFGDMTIYLNAGESYKEPGYMVVDSVDGNLTDKVKVDSNVDTNKAGVYKIIYSVTNSNGITKLATRNVIVVDSDVGLVLLNEGPTNLAKIQVYISDPYYDYLILPNKGRVNDRQLIYEVTENGTYEFTIYNKQGGNKTREIIINNIDKISPEGSCSGTYTTGSSSITINASDASGILKYVID